MQENFIKKYLIFTGFFGLLTAVSGAFLLIPATHEPSMGFFLWFMLIIIADLIALKYVFGKLHFSLANIFFVLAYIFITFGFIINTKIHVLNVFLLIGLLPLININLVTGILNKNFLQRYFFYGIYHFYSKFLGVFIYAIDLWKFNANSQRDYKKIFPKLLSFIKVFSLFVFTGLPLILVIVFLLKGSNAEFSLWIDRFFGLFNISLDDIGYKVLFISFTLPYFIGEMFVLKEINSMKKTINASKIRFGESFLKSVVLVALSTTIILNFFYLLFVIAELRFDFNDVRGLIDARGFDSFSKLAVSRFWELIFVGFINIFIIYTITKPFKVVKKTSNIIKWVFTINFGLLLINTLFLVFSVHQRISLYEGGYGFTEKRFLAHTFLPVFIVIIVLVFGGLLYKRHNRLFKLAFALLVMFFSIHVMIPTDYIVNDMNLKLIKADKIKVYDPLLTVPVKFVDTLGKDFENSVSIRSNDVGSHDGVIIAKEILNSPENIKYLRDRGFYTSTDDKLLNNIIKKFKNENKDLKWNEFNFMKNKLINE